MSRKFYVYSLRSSDEEEIFYIGKSFVGSKRLVEHLSKCRKGKENHRRATKIRSILNRGCEVLLEVLFEFDDELECMAKEKELILHYGRRDIGTGILTNHTDGGGGLSGWVPTEETRKKMSAAKIGNTLNLGRKRPDMVERFSKQVTAFSEEGRVIKTFKSARDAHKELGVHFSTISSCVLGNIRSAKCKKGIRYQFREGEILEDTSPAPPYRSRWVV